MSVRLCRRAHQLLTSTGAVIWILLVALLFVSAGAVRVQAQNIDALIAQLQSSDPNVRSVAFYALQQIGFGTSDQIRTAVIDLLSAEESYSEAQARSDAETSEGYAEYFSDVVSAVGSFNDLRARDGLIGVINTGGIAVNALAAFGRDSLDAVLGKLTSNDPIARTAAALTLQRMLRPENASKVSDGASQSKMRTALNTASTDANYYVGLSGIQGLMTLAGISVPTVTRRVMVEINPEPRNEKGRVGDKRRKRADDRDHLRDNLKAINPRSHDTIVVVILSTTTFDATSVNASTVRFGLGQAEPLGGPSVEDANNDRLQDLVFRFRINDSGIKCGDTAAFLAGTTNSQETIVGSDSIRTVGCDRDDDRDHDSDNDHRRRDRDRN